jgi:3-isopropylmalate/(R)-2-methylmalate dehydratase large subunit
MTRAMPDVSGFFDRVWCLHEIRPLGAGRSLLAIDRIFLHERTGAVALEALARRGQTVRAPLRTFCTMDHIVDTTVGRSDATRMPGGTAFITATRAAARAAGLRVFDLDDPDQGIVHVIAPELGLALPGASLVCPDSHTSTQGALGALAFGIGSTEAEHALATGALRVKRPAPLRIRVDGGLAPGVSAKDLALAIIARLGPDGASGQVIEYSGSGIRALSMEGRMTLCNLAAELSAFAAIIAPDDTTFEYVAGTPFAPKGALWDRALDHWRQLSSGIDEQPVDEVFDTTGLAPRVTWGTSPAQSVPIDVPVPDIGGVPEAGESLRRACEYMGLTPGTRLQDLAIDAAFIGSCTNGRLSDLREAARVLRGRRVAPGVRALCVPGSSRVKRAAEAEGLDRVFREAGFEWRESGCSMCFYAGGESFGRRERVISSTNRNFESRQGPETRTHLASPATVAASAVAGRITDPRTLGAS